MKPILAALCLGYRPSEQDGTYVHEMQLMRDFDMSKDYGYFPDMQKRNLYLTADSDVPVLSSQRGRLSCTWFTPILNNGATVLTTQQYDLRPQSVSDLTNEVDGKYIISVVELQQEGEYYSLSKDDLTAITAYIAETAAAFAPEAVVPSQSTFKKAGAKKRHSNTSASASTSEVEVNIETPMPTTSSGRNCKRRHIVDV
jgi:hypothetical protein